MRTAHILFHFFTCTIWSRAPSPPLQSLDDATVESGAEQYQWPRPSAAGSARSGPTPSAPRRTPERGKPATERAATESAAATAIFVDSVFCGNGGESGADATGAGAESTCCRNADFGWHDRVEHGPQAASRPPANFFFQVRGALCCTVHTPDWHPDLQRRLFRPTLMPLATSAQQTWCQLRPRGGSSVLVARRE